MAEPTPEMSADAQERSVLRWGGVSGLLAGIIFVFSIVYQVVFVGTATAAAGDGPVIRFPGVHTAIIVGQSLFLAGTILSMPLFLALYRSLRRTSLAPAIFGTGLSFLGLAVLAVESEPNVAMAPISAQYHAAGATAAQQATAVQVWQATQGMFNEFDTCAFIFLSVGLILLGVAMYRNRAIGRGIGTLSALFGAAGLIGVSLFAVDSAAFSIFALLTFVIFPLLAGWAVLRSSRPAGVGAPVAAS
ncbi:MAG: DUF4386 family protein [Thermoplasmata archaeon]|nr:DUF4386 family protein [Thermoplasmata archaeon]